MSQLGLKGPFQLWSFLFKPLYWGSQTALHRIVSVATESIVPPTALNNCSSASGPKFIGRNHNTILPKTRAQGIKSWFKAELGPEPRSTDSQANALLSQYCLSPKPQRSTLWTSASSLRGDFCQKKALFLLFPYMSVLGVEGGACTMNGRKYKRARNMESFREQFMREGRTQRTCLPQQRRAGNNMRLKG